MKLHLQILTATAAVLLAGPAIACLICRCGDPTFNALGKDGVAQTGLRLALDWDEASKSQGDPAADYETMREQRETVMVAYGVSDAFGLFARLPYSERELTTGGPGGSGLTRTSGLADPEFYGQLRLWNSAFEGSIGTRASLFAVFGVKTSLGQNNASQGGVRLDEHAQPGTGSTDGFGGLSGSHVIDPRSTVFASLQYRHTGTNATGYRYGRVTLLNLALDRKLSDRWDGVVEVNYRHAGKDRMDASGVLDEDTGGSMTYVTPRLLFSAGNGWVLRASVQVPVTQSGLNGQQHENTVLNLGVTRLFGQR